MVQCIVIGVGPSPPTSTSCPPDVIHMMNEPRLYSLFVVVVVVVDPLPCTICEPKNKN